MAGLIQLNAAGDYASLNAAVAAATGADAITISGDWAADDTTSVTWDQPCTVRISGDSLNTVGKPGRANGSYRLVEPAGHMFTVTANVDIEDMDMMSDSTGVSDEIFNVGDNDVDITCVRCHIGFSGHTDQQDLIYCTGDSITLTFKFESCMFFDVERSIIDALDCSGSTINVEFNSCSGFNISATDAARGAGGWFDGTNSGAAATYNVKAFTSLLKTEETAAFHADSGDTLNVDADYCLTNVTSGNFTGNADTSDTTGTQFSKTWVQGNPASGQIGIISTTTPYDQRLFDDAADNLAQDLHSIETGPDSGLALPSDILGTARGAAESHDVGAFEVAAAGGGLSIPIAMHHYKQMQGAM